MACIFCKSPMHDYRSCPVSYQLAKRQEIKAGMKQSFFGQSPNVFIGRHGYPRIRVGILGTEHYEGNDAPAQWSKDATPIPEIVRLRSALINSHFTTHITSMQDRLRDLAGEISLAKRPVDVEIDLAKKPQFRINFDTHAQPHGPAVELARARITENVPIDTRLERAADAQDLHAADAVATLTGKGVDEHAIVKAFSMGNFGIPLERKLVPTRWSITAVDDIRGKQLLERVRTLPAGDCVAYVGGHYGNHYLLCFFDDVWQYELFEQHVPKGHTGNIVYETDHESFAGRSAYVEETAGGYYAARIGILEHLMAQRRQSAVLAIRIITEEYTAPLGVWVVRDAVRKALATEPIRFPDRDAMLAFAKKWCMDRFRYDIALLIARSKLVRSLYGQRKLTGF
jgi:hypothetical protein